MGALTGKIAVVTGASRGAGRGVARGLGEAGATVYVTGRSARGGSTPTGRKETIEDTAGVVTAAGGVGIPVRCDHTNDAEVAALFDRVQQEQGRLDLLVNAVWGGSELLSGEGKPFWERAVENWDLMFTAGVRASLMASRFAIPLMLPHRQGLIINVSYLFPDGKYYGHFYYDLAKAALNRMAAGMAGDLKRHGEGIAAVALSPGWMRTEIVLDSAGATEENWRDFPELATTESPLYLGRAAAALAADPKVMAKTGQTLLVGELAREYGFTDSDGRQVPTFIPSEG
ncbi:MAG: SDR family NAD(P)-dependent oxidoreductase [Symbiobacteriia bacterium]